MPAFVTPADNDTALDQIRDARKVFAEYAPASGRDPDGISVNPVVRSDGNLRDTVRRFEDATVDRTIVSMPYIRTVGEARDVLGRIAEQTLHR